MANQITKQEASIRDWLNSDQLKNQIAVALPKLCTPDRFMRVLLTSMQKTPKLMQCSQASLFQSLMNCAALGIEPDGRRAHLIPYGDTCQLIIDYKGLLELVKRSGDVSVAYAEKVCKNDKFTWKDGDVSHEIDFSNPRGDAYAYYARVKGKDGSYTCVVMTKEEVEAIRARSRASKSGPWVTDFDEMGKKTAFRRLSKWLVLSPEVQMALDEADRAEFGDGKQQAAQTAKSFDEILEAATEADAEVVEEAEVVEAQEDK